VSVPTVLKTILLTSPTDGALSSKIVVDPSLNPSLVNKSSGVSPSDPPIVK